MRACPFHRFKHILGDPLKGMHKYRFLDTAVVDYALSIAAACIITYFSQIPLVLTTISVLIIGIVLHVLFGVETGTTKFLGLTCAG